MRACIYIFNRQLWTLTPTSTVIETSLSSHMQTRAAKTIMPCHELDELRMLTWTMMNPSRCTNAGTNKTFRSTDYARHNRDPPSVPKTGLPAFHLLHQHQTLPIVCPMFITTMGIKTPRYFHGSPILKPRANGLWHSTLVTTGKSCILDVSTYSYYPWLGPLALFTTTLV